MTRARAAQLLPPYAAESRRRAGGFGRLTGDVRGRARGRRHRGRHQTAADARPAVVLHRGRRHGPVSAYSGKMDMGQGLSVAFEQDRSRRSSTFPTRHQFFIGDTDTSVNQGGASGSTGVQEGGRQMRMAAAEAPRVGRDGGGKARHGVPGQVRGEGRRRRHRRCGQKGKLRRPDRRQVLPYNVQHGLLERQIRQPALCAGQGQPIRRTTPSSASQFARRYRRQGIGETNFAMDIKVPGMVHGRMIRPAVAGAVPVKVDESSIKDIRGTETTVSGQGLPRRRRRPRMGRHQGVTRAEGRVVDTRSGISGSAGAVRSHPQGADAQARSRQARR